MNMFANVVTDNSVEEETDVVSSGFKPLESGIYTFEIKQAYAGEAASGAKNVTFQFEAADGTKFKTTQYATSGRNKGGKNYYETQDGKKRYLPGFITINNICLLSAGKELHEVEMEEKVINLYDKDAGKEVPTKVMRLMETRCKEVTMSIIKQIVDKNVKDDAGNYVPSGETREENEVDKVFRALDGMTVAEIKAQAEEAVFINTWKEANEGKTRDRAKGAKSGSVAGAPAAGNTTAPAPAKSLFA